MLTFEFIENGKVLNKKIKIPKFCPKCGNKLNHVNALDTEAHMYLVYCSDYKCRYVQDYYFIEDIRDVLFCR